MLEKYAFLNLDNLPPELKERIRQWVIQLHKDIEYLK
jgi:hypothetical protein